jgi:hypothetical protein
MACPADEGRLFGATTPVFNGGEESSGSIKIQEHIPRSLLVMM